RLRRRFSLGLALGSELVDMARSGNEWVLVDRRALDEEGQQQRQQSATFNGYRAHEERLFGSAASCRGDLDARLKQTDGAAARWRFALALEFGSRTARAGRAWLHAAADFGALWGIVAEDQAADLAQRLADTGAIGSAVDLELSLAFGNAAFDRTAFLDAWASPREEDIAGALAAALPVVGNVAERQSPAARRAA